MDSSAGTGLRRILFAALFVLLLLTGAASLAGIAPSAGDRAPASFPERLDGGFFASFDAWLTDRLPGHSLWVRAANTVRENVFRTGTDEVLVGEDGFLFYAETAAGALRTNVMTDAEIDAAAAALVRFSYFVSAHGGRLLFVVAPDKATVYPEKLPASVRRAMPETASNADLLYDALRRRGVLCADLRPLLRGAEGLVYHARDTHWNSAGAAIAFAGIMDALALAHEDYASLPMEGRPGFSCDLEGMLYPGTARRFSDLVPAGWPPERYAVTSPSADPMSMRLTTAGEGQGSVLVFRDSFGSALIPYLSSAFAAARYERAVPYDPGVVEQTAPDVVIVEIAERNIPTLAAALERFAPLDPNTD